MMFFQLDIHIKTMNVDTDLLPFTKIYLKLIAGLNVK